MKYTPYLKKQAQLMRPYEPGEDMSKIGVPMWVKPEAGGFISHNPSDPDDQWYISPEHHAEHYVIAPMEHDDSVGQLDPLGVEQDILFSTPVTDFPELIDTPDHPEALINELSFGEALYHLKYGARLARKGWNGKGMWISYTPGITLDAEVHDIWTENVKRQAIDNGGLIEILPYLSMKTAGGQLQIGWLASQSDMLAHDWMMVQ